MSTNDIGPATGDSGRGVANEDIEASPRGRRRWAKLLLLGCSLGMALAASELALRLVGFSFYLHPEAVEFGWPDPILLTQRYDRDPDLFWVPKGYQGRLEALQKSQPAIVFMGDSCTEFGDYDARLLRLLHDGPPFSTVKGAKMGVGGWSSYQGLQQLLRDVIPLRPKVITLYFGWNDHWVGFGVKDSEIAGLHSRRLNALQSLRLVQLLSKVAVLCLRTESRTYRVPLDEFKENLETMVRAARDNDIIPLLCTAPSEHVTGREPRKLARRWIRHLDDLVRIHQTYVDTVRDVAETTGAPLCDLEQAFAATGRKRIYFWTDGIHLSDEGNKLAAEVMYACLKREGVLADLNAP